MKRYWRLGVCGVMLGTIGIVLAACQGSNSLSSSSFSEQDSVDSVHGANVQTVALRQASDLPPPPNTSGGLDQPIAANDVLEIKVFEVTQLDQTVEVDGRGKIALALVGEVQAAGKNPRQLEAELKKLYGARYLQKPQISVSVKESYQQRVTIDGEIKKSGLLPVSSGSTLMRIIAEAGGFTEVADPKKVYVFRDSGAQKLVVNFNVFEIRAGKRRDPRIYAGDIIIVFSSDTKVAMKNLRESLGLVATGTALGGL